MTTKFKDFKAKMFFMLCEDMTFKEIAAIARESLKEERKLKNKPPKWVNTQMAYLSLNLKDVFVFFDKINFYEIPKKLHTSSGEITLIGSFNNCIVATDKDNIYTLSKNSIKAHKPLKIDTDGKITSLAS